MFQVAQTAATEGAWYAVNEHPETTATLVVDAAADVIGTVGVESLLQLAEVVIDVLNLIITCEKHRRAKKDMGRESVEAESLLEIYEKSKAHFISMEPLMQQLQQPLQGGNDIDNSSEARFVSMEPHEFHVVFIVRPSTQRRHHE